MPKILEPNLTPEDRPWGFQVNDRLEGVESSVDRLGDNWNMNSKAIAASLDALSRQVRDLRGRVSYVASDTKFESWTVTQPENVTWGPTLTFTITETRFLSLWFSVDAHVSVNASDPNSVSGFVTMKPALFLDGAPVGPPQGNLMVALSPYGAELSAPLAARAVLPFPSGTHTLQGGFAWRQVKKTSGTGSLFGGMDAKNPSLIVDVLQIAG